MDRKNPKLYPVVVVTGIALITLLFISYYNFSKPEELGTGGPDRSFLDRVVDKIRGTDEPEGEIDDLAAQDVREGIEEVAGASTSKNTTTVWIATDYKQGEIKTGNYRVQKGDTLWEIAEAVYGDGSQWYRILEANKDSIGFLPNGSQALIVTGQSLQIP